jgi:hypothetical protein
MGRDEALAGGDHRGETAFHVRRAAAVQQAVAHDRLERVGLPLLARTGGYDIRMTGETQNGPCTAVSGPEILDRTERHALDAKAGRFQALADDLQAAMVFGADGGTADEVLGEGERCVSVGRQSRAPGGPKAGAGAVL